MSDHTTPTTNCSKCGTEKPLNEYHRNRRNADGVAVWCKACKAERQRAYYAANRERKKEIARSWYAANRERKAETRRAWYAANPKKRDDFTARHRAKYPDRYAARNEVTKAVLRGDFPPASALVCDHCQEAQAEQWHHYLGYAPEHWLDVIAVCIPCHTELDRGVA